MGFLLFLGVGIIFFIAIAMSYEGIWAFVCFGFFVLIDFVELINGIEAGKKVHELTEYKSKGTINGKMAYLEPALAELAELKTTKECIGYGLALNNRGKYDEAIQAFDRAKELNIR
jgi:tetratricopeptide (TPR) repeat protein